MHDFLTSTTPSARLWSLRGILTSLRLTQTFLLIWTTTSLKRRILIVTEQSLILAGMKRALLFLLLLPFTIVAQSIPAFSDSDYQEILRENSRVLFYSVSPSMPLSLEGLKEIRLAADDLHARLVVLVDPAATAKEIASIDSADPRLQRSSELRNRGLQLHYPSVLVASNHRLQDAPIAGFKSRTGYVALVSDLLRLRWQEEFQITSEISIPFPMNIFFKPIYGTNFIVSGNARPNYLFDVQSGKWLEIPNDDWGDPGASKDGEFITLLGVKGLSWFSTADILAGKSSLLLRDPGLRTYQSMGQSTSGTHRVLGAISSSTAPAGLIVREYEKRQRPDGGVTIAPLEEWRTVCEGKNIAIPMMSKTGLLLSGTYGGTMRVFRIGPNASECTEVFDSKVVSGKADFSADDRYMLYISRTRQSGPSDEVDAIFLADLKNGTARPIHRASPEAQLAFPGFMNPDRIVVYNQTAQKLIVLERTRRILD